MAMIPRGIYGGRHREKDEISCQSSLWGPNLISRVRSDSLLLQLLVLNTRSVSSRADLPCIIETWVGIEEEFLILSCALHQPELQAQNIGWRSQRLCRALETLFCNKQNWTQYLRQDRMELHFFLTWLGTVFLWMKPKIAFAVCLLLNLYAVHLAYCFQLVFHL